MSLFLVFLLLVTGISCGQIGLQFDYNAGYAAKYDNYKPRDYHFNYAVSDPHTGDHKSQWETKENGVVRGGYSLLEPDGTTRLVEYIADHDGFRAVVKKIGTAIHPQHYETHGNVQLPLAHYKTYDGQISNYASGYLGHAVSSQHVQLPAEEPLQPVAIEGYSSVHLQPESPVHLQPETPIVLQPETPVHLQPETPIVLQEESPVHLQPEVPIHLQPETPVHLQPEIHSIPEEIEVEQPKQVAYEVSAVQPIPYQLQQPLLYQDHQVYGGGVVAQPVATGYVGTEPRQYLEVKQVAQEAPVHAELLPISPSYKMTVEYHGLTGNPQDDAEYSHDYQGQASENNNKVVLAPSKGEENSKVRDKFLIYLPEHNKE